MEKIAAVSVSPITLMQTGNSIKASWTLVLYAGSADFVIGEELARLDTAIEVTVAGTPVDYTMAFSDGQTDKHTVFWNGAAPSGIWHINAWYRDGKVNGTGSGSISQTLT